MVQTTKTVEPLPPVDIVNSLVLLNILSKWGRHDFHPNPKVVVNFEVTQPFRTKLRQATLFSGM